MNDHFQKARETWEQIAYSFDKTRKKPWEFVKNFVQKVPTDSVVGDFGCGNGRHSLICAPYCRNVIGIDFSCNLLEHAKQNTASVANVDFVQANLITVPLQNESLDNILYIAALHNIKKRVLRQQSLKEVRRVLKPQGRALISVWSQEQDRFRNIPSIDDSSSDFERGDRMVWWNQHGLSIPRFYHLYTKKEFREDLAAAHLIVDSFSSLKIRSQQYPDNYVAQVVRK